MVRFQWLGRVNYKAALEHQRLVHKKVEESCQGVVLACEHEPTITLGVRSRYNEDLLATSQAIAAAGFEVVSTDRGGQATLHNLGQLVIYPILPLREMNWSVKGLVASLLKTTNELTRSLGIRSYERAGQPGLFTDEGKIAFIGLRVKRGVSYHGLSLNVKNNINDFQLIRPCGATCATIDRLCDHGIDAELPELSREWFQRFKSHLPSH